MSQQLRIGFFTTETNGLYSMGFDYAQTLSELENVHLFRIPYKQYCEQLGTLLTQEKILDFAKRELLDIVIYPFDGALEFSPYFFSRLTQSCFTILHLGDDEHHFDRVGRYLAQAFDLVLSASPTSVSRYEVYGIKALFFPSCFPISDFLHVQANIKHDVVFVGSLADKIGRKQYLNNLIDLGFDVGIYGYGTPGGVISRQEMIALFKGSKIALNFTGVAKRTHLDAQLSINHLTKQVKGRPQEIALSHGLILSECAPGIDQLFIPNHEISLFSNSSELVHQVRHLLASPEYRSQLKHNAFIRASNQYDSHRQWSQLLNQLRLLLPSRQTPSRASLYLDSGYLSAYSAFHLKSALDLFRALKLKLMLSELRMSFQYSMPDFKYFQDLVLSHLSRSLRRRSISLTVYRFLSFRNR